jgi:hypothetical protein
MRLKKRSGFFETRKTRIVTVDWDTRVFGITVLKTDTADDGGVVADVVFAEVLNWFRLFHSS